MQRTDTGLRFCWFPYGDRDLASSRLRCFYIHDELLHRGYQSHIGFLAKSDIAIVQKRIDSRAFLFAIKAKLCRQLLVFDIDDLFPLEDRKWCRRTRAMINLADVTITATAEQAAYLRAIATKRTSLRLKVLPNAIDYGLEDTVYSTSRGQVDRPTICWFGNSVNLGSIYDEFHYLHDHMENVHFVVVSEREAQLPELPFADPVKWNRESFVNIMQGCDICVLSHFGSVITQAKSANKMISSIMCGVPVVASRTPDYTRVAEQCGISDFLFDDLASLVQRVQSLWTICARQEYLRRSQPILLENYSISRITGRLVTDCLTTMTKKR